MIKNYIPFIGIILLIVATITMAGCSWNEERSKQQTLSQQPQKANDMKLLKNQNQQPDQKTGTSPSIVDTSNWKTYKNSKYHLSVKYPPSWNYIEDETAEKDIVANIEKYQGAYSPEVFSLMLSKDVKADTIDSGIVIEVLKQTLSKAAGYEPMEIFFNREPSDIISQKEVIIGGQKATRYETKESHQKTETSGEASWHGITYVLEKDANVYSIGTFGIEPNEDALNYVDQIAGSLIIGNVE